MKPKFLVCTMYCGEPDFPHHVEALKAQGVEYEHRVFKNMLEVDGHNAVYQTFNEAGPEWIRLKLDADVVLDPGILVKLATKVGQATWVDPLVNDYFTASDIHAGAACYGPGVRFSHQTLTLKCDRRVASVNVATGFGVLGRHAHYADELRAFHYGLHRGMKGQVPIMRQVQSAWDEAQDPVRFAALRGFEVAFSDLYWRYAYGFEGPPMDHNYGDPKFKELFDLYRDGTVKPPTMRPDPR